MTDLFKSLIGQLRIVGLTEGVSYIVLLFVAMPLKYLAANPTPVKILGMLHGILFILFAIYLVVCHFRYGWSIVKTILLLLLSLVPFGNFVADKYILHPEAEKMLKTA